MSSVKERVNKARELDKLLLAAKKEVSYKKHFFNKIKIKLRVILNQLL
jgi:hypothetical protein